MHRRTFLRTSTLAASAGLLATACGDGGADGTGAADLSDLGPAEDQTLAVLAASLEYLTGQGRWLAFGVTGLDRTPLAGDREVQLYLRELTGDPDAAGEVVLGPLQATYAAPEDTGQGVWYAQADLEEAGLFEVVAVSGDDFGTAAVQVVDPQESRVVNPEDGSPVIPGSAAISAATPTEADPGDVFALCTQDPPCGMHEVSLDEALASGKPVAVMFATPQFCQTAVCGPSVATMDRLRQDGEWGDTVFIHSEIFAEEPTGENAAATPLLEAVQAWGLPTEPWLFTIAADGTIQGRLDGPMPAPILEDVLGGLTA